jgi:hypothetical protein
MEMERQRNADIQMNHSMIQQEAQRKEEYKKKKEQERKKENEELRREEEKMRRAEVLRRVKELHQRIQEEQRRQLLYNQILDNELSEIRLKCPNETHRRCVLKLCKKYHPDINPNADP